jgi:hypothetical protein
VRSTNKKGEILANLSLSLKRRLKSYFFFFLTAFFLAGAFFLVAMENHPLVKSRVRRKVV